MKKIHLILLAIATVSLCAGTAHAIDIDGKKGIGYAQAIGGPAGLAFNYGLGNMAIEGILGIDYNAPDEGDAVTSINLGVGVHFAALRASNAAFTVGGRLNLGTGKGAAGVDDMGNATEAKDVTQFGLDIPMRVYWFADKNFSLHFEQGIAVVMGPEDGLVFPGAAPKGTNIQVFKGNFFGNVGGTFWF